MEGSTLLIALLLGIGIGYRAGRQVRARDNLINFLWDEDFRRMHGAYFEGDVTKLTTWIPRVGDVEAISLEDYLDAMCGKPLGIELVHEDGSEAGCSQPRGHDGPHGP